MRELNPDELEVRLATSSGRLLLLYLWGRDCPNCEIFKRSLPRLLPQLEQLPVDFVALNVYEHPEVARRFAVYGIPHFLLFHDGNKLGKMSEFRGEAYFLAVVREQVARLLRVPATGGRRPPSVLIVGETGTGKGLLAASLHRASGRAAGPFVDVNCAAIPETMLEAELFGYERGAFTDARQAKPGLFQLANGGTLFLDELGLLPLGLQSKLLRVIEERSVRRLGSTRSEPLDVWIVAATSEDLTAAVRARRFREDLYHRLAVVTVQLPPLRERGGDIVKLAERFLARA